ncbi:MAG TPA: phosphoribosyltransferase family protein [Ktedonobacteraceae bacterium]|nr:phosphoribosyltransferase family protein [Ktedonobacteraceae bacterium]
MNDPTIMQMFIDVGAIVTDSHFVYTSGRHSSVYINKDALYLHTGTISALCKMMVEQYDPAQIDVVVGPVLGGIVLSQWVAHHLNQRRTGGETLAIYAEKASDGRDKQFFFGRGYGRYIEGKNVLVVEDVLTTGGSARQVIEVVRNLGGNVVGLSALCNRGNVRSSDVGDVTVSALVSIDLDTYAPEDCPLCKANLPVNTELGKGKAFLA